LDCGAASILADRAASTSRECKLGQNAQHVAGMMPFPAITIPRKFSGAARVA
jgi:hypothetical protein